MTTEAEQLPMAVIFPRMYSKCSNTKTSAILKFNQ